SGSGKSTLLRAIAGTWPFGRGSLRLGKGQIAFVPQRSYLPLGTLAEILLYPDAGTISVPADLPAVLDEVGLGELADKLKGSGFAPRIGQNKRSNPGHLHHRSRGHPD